MELTRFIENQLKNQSRSRLILKESCYTLFQNISPFFDKYLLIEVFQVNELFCDLELNLNPEIILKEPKFKDKIFVHYQNLNVLFPVFNHNNALSGFITRNYLSDGFVKESFIGQEYLESLWISNYDNNSPIHTLFVSGEPIEAINHYQFNEEELRGKNVVYVATGGNMYKEQLERIDEFIVTHFITNIVSIFDDNLGGLYHTAHLIGHLKCIKKPSCNLALFDFSNIYSLPTSSPAEVHLWFSCPEGEGLDKLFKSFFNHNTFLDGKFEINDFEDNKFEVFFPKKSKCHWETVHQFLNEFNEIKIINHFPFFGSFTEDIKQFKDYNLFKP